jgi:hypothetical protein
MATAAIHGKSGKVTVGSAVAEVTSWSMSRTTAADDATSMDSSGNAEFIDGLFNWSGSFTTLVYGGLVGAQAAATFSTAAAASATTPTFSGAIIITDEPIQVEVNGVVQYQYTFQGTGACTVATT